MPEEEKGWGRKDGYGQLRRQKLEISVHLSAVSSHLAVSQVAKAATPLLHLLLRLVLTILLLLALLPAVSTHLNVCVRVRFICLCAFNLGIFLDFSFHHHIEKMKSSPSPNSVDMDLRLNKQSANNTPSSKFRTTLRPI